MSENNTVTFDSLLVGDVFIFESEITMPYSGMMRGPWVKTSKRKYQLVAPDKSLPEDCHTRNEPFVCRVGSVNTMVIKKE